MRLSLAVMSVGLGFALLCGAALSWDAGAILFQLLDQQAPAIPHSRWINLPLQLPVLLASRVTDDLPTLMLVYGLPYVAVPLLALAASWWVVRDRAPWLVVWPSLAIGLGMLPGQLNFTAEANIVLELFWPVALATLVGVPRSRAPFVVALALALAVSHPYAIGLLGVAAGLAGAVAQRRLDRAMWRWAGGFAALGALSLLRFWLLRSPYESEQLSPASVGWSAGVSTAGLPLLAIGLALGAGALELGRALVPQSSGRLRQGLFATELCFALLAGLALVLWARDPRLWQWANRFTYPALFVTLAFVALALVDWLLHNLGAARPSWPRRRQVAQLTSVVFAVVLVTQSTAWLALSGRLVGSLRDSRWSCVPMSSLGWLRGTALDQFATPAYALLLQGRAPARALLNQACGQPVGASLELSDFYRPAWQGGWFHLAPLRDRLVGERDAPQGCSFALTSGWHVTERDGPYWWRWSDGRDARLSILVEADTVGLLRGEIETLDQPTQVRVTLNGAEQPPLAVDHVGLQPFGPLALPLRRGANVLQLVSDFPAQSVDGRPLALDISNLTLVTEREAQVCLLRPT